MTQRKTADWRELLASKLDKPPETARSTAFRTTPAIDRILNEAASRRHMSVSAYVRRAAVAIACRDLGLNWDEVMQDEPGFGIYGERPGRAVIRPNGHGFGAWRVTGLETHHPDDQ